MYKFIFTALVLATTTMNAQEVVSKKLETTKVTEVSDPLVNLIQSSKSKIEAEKEKIVKTNTILLEASKKKISDAEVKYQKATALYEKEKIEYKQTIATEKEVMKYLTNEIKKYK